MENPAINLLRTQANQLLEEAQAQINRAEEDVVTHLVCQNSRKSMANYLSSFLLQNGVEPPGNATLSALHQQCIQLDPKFESLNLSSMTCKGDEKSEAYCMTIKDVGNCLQLAHQTKSLTNQPAS